MSGSVSAWVWEQNLGNPTRKLILLKIADGSNDDGWSIAPRQARLAAQCDTTRQTVNQHLRALRGLGVLQEATYTVEGRTGTEWRIMGPWVSENPTGVGKADSPFSPSLSPSPPDPLSHTPLPLNPLKDPPRTKPKSQDLDVPNPVHLGQKRWRVYSDKPGRGPFVADLATQTCTCENTRRTTCRHLTVAMEAMALAESGRRKEYRDAVWDAMVAAFGAPTKKKEAARGGNVMELAELLAGDARVERSPDGWAKEVSTRYAALTNAWGIDKVTEHAFVTNWFIGGKLVHGVPDVSNNEWDRYNIPVLDLDKLESNGEQ